MARGRAADGRLGKMPWREGEARAGAASQRGHTSGRPWRACSCTSNYGVARLPPHKVCSPVCKGGVALLVGFLVEWQIAQGQGESLARLCRVNDGDAFGATHLRGGVVF